MMILSLDTFISIGSWKMKKPVTFSYRVSLLVYQILTKRRKNVSFHEKHGYCKLFINALTRGLARGLVIRLIRKRLTDNMGHIVRDSVPLFKSYRKEKKR